MRLRDLAHADNRLDGFIKDGLEAILSESRALEIRDGSNLLSQPLTFGGSDGGETVALQCVQCFSVLAQVDLRSNENKLCLGAVVGHLWPPLAANVREGGRRDDGEAEQENISSRIAQWA